MTAYTVQKGDTISTITKRLGTNWETLRRNNPKSIGKSRNGNWFFKEGARISTGPTFDKTLQTARKEITPEPPVPARAENNRHQITHTIAPGDTIWELAVRKYHVHVEDIMRDNNISDPRSLQVGQKLRINLPEHGEEQQVVASWYGDQFHGKPMANGDIYDMYAPTIAHKEMPLGTRVELKNSDTGTTVQAVVTDRGPYVDGRDVDLSYGLAQKLSLIEQGVGNLVMKIL